MQAMEEKPQLAVEGKDPASDEEIARRLQQQLNGEAAAAARRRTRKQPTFYSPQVLHAPHHLAASLTGGFYPYIKGTYVLCSQNRLTCRAVQFRTHVKCSALLVS